MADSVVSSRRSHVSGRCKAGSRCSKGVKSRVQYVVKGEGAVVVVTSIVLSVDGVVMGGRGSCSCSSGRWCRRSWTQAYLSLCGGTS